MAKRFLELYGMFPKQGAEEKFKEKDFEGAVLFASMAKMLNPKMDGVDEALIAYEVHLAASQKRCDGETNWYRVLGAREGSGNIESIKEQHSKLAAMVNSAKNASTLGALKLNNKALRILRSEPNEPKSVSSTNRNDHEDSRIKKGSGGVKVEKKACPRCNRWCKYVKPKASSSSSSSSSTRHKHGDRGSESVHVQVTCPSCRCKFDPISGKKVPPSSRFSSLK